MTNIFPKAFRYTLFVTLFITVILLTGIIISYLTPTLISIYEVVVIQKKISAILLIVIVITFFILNFLGWAKKKWSLSTLSLPLIGFMAVSFVVNISNSQNLNDFRWLLISAGFPLLYISITGFFKSKKSLLYILIFITALSLIIVILLTFTDSTGKFPSLNGVIQNRYRVYLLDNAYGPITLATMSSTLLILCISQIFFLSDDLPKFIVGVLYFAIVFSLLGLITSGGRTAWFSAAFVFILLIFFAWQRKRQKIIKMLLFFPIIIGILAISPIWNIQLLQRASSLLTIITIPTNDYSVSSRIEFWKNGFTMFLEQPWGSGFLKFEQNYGVTTHNEYLNILIGAGIVGCFLYLSFFAILTYSLLRRSTKKNSSPFAIIAFLMIVHILIISLTEAWSVSNSFVSIIFWITLSIGSIDTNTRKISHESKNYQFSSKNS